MKRREKILIFINYIREESCYISKVDTDKKGKTSYEKSEISKNDLKKDMILARAIVAKISSRVHPDKFVNDKTMQNAAAKLCTLINRINNKLKGLS